ncbi:hypothetical protein GUITHDRAFT_113714 [Guillardia theta CCMP2712]|uniref:SH3 domain-containing protein n=1 Tax=Guillardia theta (strain CCMP2712) TaxID=905079 RepID=L1IWM0_GUITC|nr:hypothetical protein GUITHDRAFT_113714 [Guillardia theta CCMP2712]EKX40235.1 hypothetical protein GUITHDRAFT_113714 [Guillardia theta CCMP2712]|eukprot:XP_005827215.1 hypothetical protein GUITHDRAFT_113714 [Guillardia theta CCMP2712]
MPSASDPDENEEGFQFTQDQKPLLYAQAFSNFDGAEEGAMSLQEGDVVAVDDTSDSGWWLGRKIDVKDMSVLDRGKFPKSFVVFHSLPTPEDDAEVLDPTGAQEDMENLKRVVKEIIERRGNWLPNGELGVQGVIGGLTEHRALSFALKSALESSAGQGQEEAAEMEPTDLVLYRSVQHVIENEPDQVCSEMLWIARRLQFNMNLKDKEGQTLLMRSSSLGRSFVVQELLELNADVDVVNLEDGSTALIQAARERFDETVSLLIRARADCSVVDHHGVNALRYVVNEGEDQEKLWSEKSSNAVNYCSLFATIRKQSDEQAENGKKRVRFEGGGEATMNGATGGNGLSEKIELFFEEDLEVKPVEDLLAEMKNKSEDEMRSLLSSLPVERIQQISEALDWERDEEEKQRLKESTQKKEAQVL